MMQYDVLKLPLAPFYSESMITQYHKSSSVVNSPAPHEYGLGSLKNEIQVNAIRWPFLTNQNNGSQ